MLTFILQQIFLLISYISNVNSFPKPLTAEEEHVLLLKFEKGDFAARNILIERNMRLVAHIAKKYMNAVKDTDDLVSIGTIGLIKGVSNFDVNKGAKLSTFLARCIENAIVS